jgi:HlyD family secretion protein
MTVKTTNKKQRRRWPWIVGGVAVVAVVAGPLVMGAVTGRRPGSLAALAQGAPGAAGAATAIASANGRPAGQIVTVTPGDLAATATASGNIRAGREARLSLERAGTVADVPVAEGDAVAAGDVLVRLETSVLERAVRNAELNLTIQEANLRDLTDGSTAAEIASAQAAVDSARARLADVRDGADPNDLAAARAAVASAQAALDDALDGPDPDKVAQSEASLRNAEAALRQAQTAYDRIAGNPDVGMRREALELQQATNNLDSARAAYQQASRGATADQVAQARSTVAQARATLQKLLDSPTPSELAAAESSLAQAESALQNTLDGAGDARVEVARAQVEQARLNLEEARANLADATLTAPFDGVITAVHVAAGERASGLAVEIADTGSLELALDVDEVDLGEIAVGQPATVTLETWPDRPIPGTVSAIAPAASAANSAIVSYEVTVKLPQAASGPGATDLPVRIGMTADADLVTAARKGVLVVPNQAITADRKAGTYAVNLVGTAPGGETTYTMTPVTIGLKDGEHTEITGGLRVGDRVLIGAITTAAPERTNGFMPPAPGGMGGGGAFGR